MDSGPILLWEMRAGSGRSVTCVLEAKRRTYLLTATFGENVVKRSEFPTRAEAVMMADLLFDDLVLQGWTEVERPED